MADKSEGRAKIGQQVRLPGSPPLLGTVVEVSEAGGSTVYKVFLSGDDQRFVSAASVELVEPGDDFRVIGRDEFLRRWHMGTRRMTSVVPRQPELPSQWFSCLKPTCRRRPVSARPQLRDGRHRTRRSAAGEGRASLLDRKSVV